MFNSLQPHGLELARLLYPWNSPGKNTVSEQPFPSPGDLPNSGIEPGSPELQADSLPLSHQGSLQFLVYVIDHALPSLYHIASFIIGFLGEGSIFLHDICKQKAFHSFQQIVQNPQLSIQGPLQPFTYPLPHQFISTHSAPRHAFSAMYAEVSKCPPPLIKIGKSKFDVISCKEKCLINFLTRKSKIFQVQVM